MQIGPSVSPDGARAVFFSEHDRLSLDLFLADLRSGATVDRHLADQLVLFAALAHGRSRYVVPQVTDHVLSNVWLVSQFGATVRMASKSVTVDGINLERRVVP